jgi:hypothetical protein
MAETDADLVQEAKEQFKICEDAADENRKRGEEDIRFGRMGEQWPEEIRKQREADGRPVLKVNQMPTFVRQVVNDARQNKPGIKVHPVDSVGDPQTASILSDLIRNIEASSDAEVAYDTAIDNAASRNVGYFRIDLEYAHEDAFDLDIKINRIMDPASVFGDPQSKAADSSDWDVAFVVNSLKLEEFKRKYPKAKATVDWRGGDGVDSGWRSESEIRVAEYWKRTEEEREIALLSNGMVVTKDYLAEPVEGAPAGVKITNGELLQQQGANIARTRRASFYKVTQRLVTGAEVLKTVDWLGRYIPIVPVYGEEVVIDGERQLFSLIHWGMDPQRIYNYGRSASIESAALQPKAPFIGPVGAFKTDATKWASANTKNHAYLQYDLVDGVAAAPQRQMPPQPSAAWLEEARVASTDIKSAIGLHNASLGQRSNEVSGKAIVARELEGDVSTFHFIDNLSRGIRHGGRIIVDLIPKVYSKPRMIRVLGEDRKQSRMVKIGPQPQAQQSPQPAPGAPSAGPAPAPMPPGPQPDPRAAAMDRIYDLTIGKYDVTVTAGPSYTTRRQEAGAEMIDMLKIRPELGPLIGDIVARNLDWPGSDEIAERLEAARGAASGAQQPQQDPMAKAQADAAAKVKSAEIQAQADIQIAEIEAKTKEKRDMLEVASQERVAVARAESEARLATQKAVIAATTGTPQTPVHPGGAVG